jgi:neopullulanase
MKISPKILLLVLISHLIFAQKHDLKIEPAEWWIGMKEPNLQLLVHGSNITKAKVKLNYPGVVLGKIHQTESPNYLFVDLKISPNTQPGSVAISIGNEVVKLVLYKRKAGSAQREGFSAADAIYLITPDRFANGNPQNDNLTGYADTAKPAEEYGRHGGDIQGITQNLGYIKNLGMTAIWPMPLEDNNMVQWSYHGYAITDFYKIDPRFGSNDDYQNLVTEAQKLGLKSIKDVVLNHCGTGHWWMADLPFKNWINNEGKFAPTNHRREVTRDPHAAAIDQKTYTEGWFVPTMPDLNQANPYMANYLIQNCLWWIEKYNLSGFRVDTYPYSDMTFLQKWSARMMAEYPKLGITTEEWSTNPAIAAYWQKGKINSDGYTSSVSSPMDFGLQEALVKALNDKEGWNTGLLKLYEVLANDFQYANASQLLIFGDNHDMSRLYTQLGHNKSKLKMALAILATTRGIPQLYYGTELLLANPKSDSHGEIRADMPGGGWSHESSNSPNAFTGSQLSPDQQEVLSYTQKLFNYRKGSEAIKNGSLTHFVPQDGVYVYFRICPKQKLMVVVNKNDKAINLESNRFQELLKGKTSLKNVLDKQSESFPLKVGAVEVAIYEL